MFLFFRSKKGNPSLEEDGGVEGNLSATLLD
jgi:hypothetical protein